MDQQNTISPSVGELWFQVLCFLEQEVDAQTFESWFKPLDLLEFKDGVFMISVPNDFFRDQISRHHLPLLKKAFSHAGYAMSEASFVVSTTLEEKNKKMDSFFPAVSLTKPKPKITEKDDSSVLFNTKYTFDNFIVGDGNRYAHAACVAVGERPAKAYNPLVIYGASGLGKTHLMHSIGRKAKELSPRLRISLVTSEDFLNQMVFGIQNNKMDEFRERYRKTDILLIDDIQFVEKKEGLQTELFHTFNTLFDAHKQIVASSDRPVREIRIEERLRSRFGMGLCADIQPPDFETRLAILKKLAEREHYTASIPEDVFSFIANKFKNNIRLLEGSLRRVVSMASILKMEISVPQVDVWLRDMMEPEQKPVSAEDIKRAVSNHFHLKPGDFESKRRTAHLAFPRQIAMYLIREITPMSLPETGRLFGNRDHTTVMYAVEQISKKAETDPSLNQLLQDLIKTAKVPRA